MPTYEYTCSNCSHKFDAFHSMSADPLVECPMCHEDALIKLMGAGAAAIVRGTKTPCIGGRKKKDLKKLGSDPFEAPFWRSSEDGRPRKDILKNPEKYIKTGEV